MWNGTGIDLVTQILYLHARPAIFADDYLRMYTHVICNGVRNNTRGVDILAGRSNEGRRDVAGSHASPDDEVGTQSFRSDDQLKDRVRSDKKRWSGWQCGGLFAETWRLTAARSRVNHVIDLSRTSDRFRDILPRDCPRDNLNPLHSYVACDSVFISGASLSSLTRHFFKSKPIDDNR
ncbi:PREDICTED: uncharacterized protein LOC105564701 [Vollenhovia emeryi]|uniref:uncharacterized protein LOC105564701 n=1 Tax=Vollenhovia emeryi TaxID=411798 RepID=UPI0005F4A430|nr:PREDICTED: uncharacterized protein LOC105564701 [Vollenhovia emeryi]